VKRRLVFWLVIIAITWVIVSNHTQVQKLAVTLSRGKWQWLLAAAFLQCVYYLLYAALYKAAFYTVEVGSQLRRLVPVLFGAMFFSLVAPGVVVHSALFTGEAVRNKQPAARAAAGTLLVLVARITSFTLVLAAGLFYLSFQHDLKIYEIIASIILLLLAAGLSAVLLLGLWNPAALHRLLAWLQSLVSRGMGWLKRPSPLPVEWAGHTTAEFTDAAVSIRAHPGRLALTFGVALGAYVIDLLSLAVIFRAYGERPLFGPLVAGFSMAILFWLVAVTPEGVGVVEGTMALVFISLGFPSQTATAIALAFRGLTFWLPVLAGFVVLRKLQPFGMEGEAVSELWGVRLAAIFTGLMGVINLFSAIMPAMPTRLAALEQFSPLSVREGSHLAAALAGFALLLLAANLWRRKRIAWLVTMIVLVFSAVTHVYKDLEFLEAAFSAGLAIWLFTQRKAFHARSDPPSVRSGLGVLAGALLFTLAYGAAGFYLLDRHFSVRFNLFTALRQTVVMFTSFYDPGLEPVTRYGRFFASSIYLVAAATFGYALLALVQPVWVRRAASPAERQRAGEIVEAYGRTALARLTLLNDKTYYFSPGGSLVAFVARGRVALVLGDPVGPPVDLAAALQGFKEYCARNDWQPVFYQALPDALAVYQGAGFRSACIGHEAVIDLASFDLHSPDLVELQGSVARVTGLGYTAQVYESPLTDELLHELHAISDEWLTLISGVERRYSRGWFDEEYIRSSRVIVIYTGEGIACAFANLLPEYQRSALSVDLMRLRNGADKDTLDFLFVNLFSWAADRGYSAFDLGLSGLSVNPEKNGDPVVERTLQFILEHVNTFYDFKGLDEFKARFHPTWSPRYLVYTSPANLPALALALVRADSGDSFGRGLFGRNRLKEA
jgi:phosphatidylglycerol lysyltransferase